MRRTLLITSTFVAALSYPAMAQPTAPVIVLKLSDARNALAGNHKPGIALKELSAIDAKGTHVTLATVRRDAGEPTGLSHDHVTEIYQVLDGSAVLTTGGIFSGGGRAMTSKIDPGIGPSHEGIIQDGKQQKVEAGDTVVIMSGTPHQFSNVDDHITYMVTRFGTEKY